MASAGAELAPAEAAKQAWLASSAAKQAEMVERLRSGPAIEPHWDTSHPPELGEIPADADVAAADVLSGEAIAAYREHGFLVVRGLLSDAEVSELKRGIATTVRDWPDGPSIPASAFGPDEAHFTPLVDFDASLAASAPEGTDPCDTVRRLFRVSRHLGPFARIATDERLVGPVRAHVVPPGSGADASGVALLQSMCLLKPPGSGEKSWHQDQAYFRATPIDRVAAWWVALDHTDADNGCMVVAPGSHQGGITPHAAPTPTAKTAYRAVSPPAGPVVPITLRPGDGLLFSGRTLHMTPPNGSARRRWALQLHYAWAGCREQRCDGAERPLRRPNATYPLAEAEGGEGAAPAASHWDASSEARGGFDCVEPQFWYYRSAELLASGCGVPGSITDGMRRADGCGGKAGEP